MLESLNQLDEYVEAAQALMNTIITNIVLLGQIPAPTYHENERAVLFLERLAEFQVDECTTDGYNNPVGIIHGTSQTRPPIFVVAHMDTAFGSDIDHNFTIGKDTISGAGLLDNSLGAGVLASLPAILRHLDLQFKSDIVLAGVIQSIGKGNLRGIRHLLRTWPSKIRGAICIESGELGRLNYFSNGMSRCEIVCRVNGSANRSSSAKPANAIVVINDVINKIRDLKHPPQPSSSVIFGTIQGGMKHGQIANNAKLGFEIRSDSDAMVTQLYTEIRNITKTLSRKYDVTLKMKTISNVRTASLEDDHPLVQSARSIMRHLEIQPIVESSESELSIFLSKKIPALTLGITHGAGYQQKEATMRIAPMSKGIAQIISLLQAIDAGVCDEPPMD